MAVAPKGFNMTVPAGMVELGVRNVVADSLDIDSDRVSLLYVTRKRGGGVEAEVRIAAETGDK